MAQDHDDAEGTTEREDERFSLEQFTDSALDHLLATIDRDAEESAAQDRLERGVVLA